MNIYKIEQTDNSGCETYAAAIVVASSLEAACLIHPASTRECPIRWRSNPSATGFGVWLGRPEGGGAYDYGDADWARMPPRVRAVLVGQATDGLEEGDVLCASYRGC